MQGQELINAILHLTNEVKELRGDLKSNSQTKINKLSFKNNSVEVDKGLLSTLKSIDTKFFSYTHFLATIEKDLKDLNASDLCLEDLQSNLKYRLKDFNILSELEYNLLDMFHQLITRLENDY